MTWKINTSNPGKLAEYKQFLGNVESRQLDLDEPDADMITIIRYKASQFDDSVLVDDVSLDIVGARPGSLIRWNIHNLHHYIGNSAEFVCLIGLRRKDKIFIFRGHIAGTIVAPRGQSFGFNNFFQPHGLKTTFGELIPSEKSPRKIAIDQLLLDKPFAVEALLKTWNGPFQQKGS